MGKRIVILSDGTGNSAAKVWRTNVWRTFESLDLSNSDQIAVYDDGVGTSSFKPMALLGGAFGVGLKRNVLGLYEFLCRNYKSAADYTAIAASAKPPIPAPAAGFTDDEIFLFGFSRGAFTVRVLSSLVLHQGLVAFDSEAELGRKARAAYRAFRSERYPGWTLERPLRMLRNLFASYKHNPAQRPVSKIDFIGVWDTVAAYGSPIDEMTRGFSRYIWPLELPSHELNRRIVKARHALAIDEERTAFAPELWDEPPPTAVVPLVSNGNSIQPNDRLVQVWFSGVHANVGGGYPDDSVANVSLNWMMAEAAASGLVFKTVEPNAVLRVKGAQDKDGRLYDSRAGIGGYYRYGPRKITEFYPGLANNTPGAPVPKIHQSVFDRIQVGAHLYAPINLPDKYELVQSNTLALVPLGAAHGNGLCETTNGATARFQRQESVWNLVWKRRVIYFLTVFASIYTAIYPLVRESFAFQEMATRLRIVSDTIKLVGMVLPGAATRWLDGYERDPLWFILWVGTIGFLIWYGTGLKSDANSRMRNIWNTYLPGNLTTALTRAGRVQWAAAWWIFIAALIYVALYPLIERVPILSLLTLPNPADDLLNRYSAQPLRFVVWTFLIIHFFPEAAVQWLRTRELYKRCLWALKQKIAPFGFAVAILYAGFAIANHILFNVRDSFGSFCQHSANSNGPLHAGNDGFERKDGKESKSIGLYDSSWTDHRSLCFSTGVFAKRGQQYTIAIHREPMTVKWTFWGEPAFMSGQPISRLTWWKQPVAAMLFPLRRSFDRPWSSFVVRYGPIGNEESFLDREPPGLDDDLSHPLGYKIEDVPDDSESLGEKWTAKRDGEIYIYLNKPMLGIPGIETLVSRWIPNTGHARIAIERR